MSAFRNPDDAIDILELIRVDESKAQLENMILTAKEFVELRTSADPAAFFH